MKKPNKYEGTGRFIDGVGPAPKGNEKVGTVKLYPSDGDKTSGTKANLQYFRDKEQQEQDAIAEVLGQDAAIVPQSNGEQLMGVSPKMNSEKMKSWLKDEGFKKQGQDNLFDFLFGAPKK